MQIKAIIHKLIQKYDTNNPFYIAKKRNILIFHQSLGGILGYHTVNRRVQMIYLNADLPDHMKSFVCAHELGHSILHPQINTPFLRQNTLLSVERIEREANRFAVELSITDDDLSKHHPHGITIQEASSIYGVPQELVTLKQFNTHNISLFFFV